MPSQRQDNVSAFFIARLLGEIGFVIAIPLVAFVYIGHWLDTKLGFKAVFIFVGLIIALTISSYIIYRKVKSLP